MPWIETCVMEERIKFVMSLLKGTYSMSELCSYYNISRKTGYKWLERYRQGGIRDLYDRSLPRAKPAVSESEPIEREKSTKKDRKQYMLTAP